MRTSSFKTILSVCAFLVIVSVGVAQAGAVINFDDLPSYSKIPYDHYKAQGILLSTPGAAVWEGYDPEANTLPNICFASWGDYVSADAPIIVDFVLPGTTTPGVTSIVSFYLMDSEFGTGGTWKAEIFGAGGNLLDSISGNTNDEIFIGFARPTHEIARLVFTPSEDREGIDTLAHCDVVPEPASLSILALGALGLIFRRRR